MLSTEQLFVPLFLPADKLDKLDKAIGSGASCIFIDLEDGMSAKNRDSCLQQTAELLQQNDNRIPLAVRICALSTKVGMEQFAHLQPYLFRNELANPTESKQQHKPSVSLIIPKADQQQMTYCNDRGLQPLAFIENIQGLHDLRANVLAKQSSGLLLGAADMAVSLNCATNWEAMLMARSEMVFNSALAQVPCVDTPYFQINDSKGLITEAKRAFGLGFSGKMAIHPKQVEPIIQALTPSQQEYDLAAQIIAQSTDGASSIAGIMVDRPVIINAKRIVDRYLWANHQSQQNLNSL